MSTGVTRIPATGVRHTPVLPPQFPQLTGTHDARRKTGSLPHMLSQKCALLPLAPWRGMHTMSRAHSGGRALSAAHFTDTIQVTIKKMRTSVQHCKPNSAQSEPRRTRSCRLRFTFPTVLRQCVLLQCLLSDGVEGMPTVPTASHHSPLVES